MKRRCIALLSGGLDSMLAIRIMQEQAIEVEALNFKTLFTCCQDQSAQVARDLGVRLTVVGQDDDYLQIIKRPQFGFGKGANPCVDCRIYMFQKAKRYMEHVAADFIVSGEVVGQRPMSQKRRDLEVISQHSELEDLLLRPLSAKRLPPTRPEREGWVDRSQLYDFVGRSRKGLLKLARQFGFSDLPSPSTGCALTEQLFSRKVHDLRRDPQASRWDFELLNVGRHFRFDESAKIIVGRTEQENSQLEYLAAMPAGGSQARLVPSNFPGPLALVTGRLSEEAVQFAGGLVMRYGKPAVAPQPLVEVTTAAGSKTIPPRLTDRVLGATTIADRASPKRKRSSAGR